MKYGVATQQELRDIAEGNIREFKESLTRHGFTLEDAYFTLQQGPSCWDGATARWLSPKRATSPNFFRIIKDKIDLLVQIFNPAQDDFEIGIWKTKEFVTTDGTLRLIHAKGVFVGMTTLNVCRDKADPHYKIYTDAWEAWFYPWLDPQIDLLQKGLIRCQVCGLWFPARDEDVHATTHHAICPECKAEIRAARVKPRKHVEELPF